NFAILACTRGLVNFSPSRRACSVGVRTSEISMCLLLLSGWRDDRQPARAIVRGETVVKPPIERQVIAVRSEMVSISGSRGLKRRQVELRRITALLHDQIGTAGQRGQYLVTSREDERFRKLRDLPQGGFDGKSRQSHRKVVAHHRSLGHRLKETLVPRSLRDGHFAREPAFELVLEVR